MREFVKYAVVLRPSLIVAAFLGVAFVLWHTFESGERDLGELSVDGMKVFLVVFAGSVIVKALLLKARDSASHR